MEEELRSVVNDSITDIPDITRDEETITSLESQGELILKKCVRKGDKVCYSKVENINMLQNVKKSTNNKKSSYDATDQPDRIMSGESLYKAFTFQQGSNDEETDKCIAFWKSVMERNLAPIKCTIIENTKGDEPIVSEGRKPSVEPDDEKLKTEIAKIHDQYKTMWLGVLSDLQKKRLHEIKLIGKSRCKICDSPLEEFLHKVSKAEIKQEIEELNNWTSKSKPIDQLKSSKLQEETTAPKKRASAVGEDGEKIVKPEAPEPDTNMYKHRDIIKEKRASGAYSKWRTNKVETTCPCGYPDCDCNTNPAIISIEIPSELRMNSLEDGTILERAASTSGESEKSSEFRGREHHKDRKATAEYYEKKLSVMVQCVCGKSDCDCVGHKELLGKLPLEPFIDTSQPPVPPKLLSPRKPGIVSSIEVFGKRLRSKAHADEHANQHGEQYGFSHMYDSDTQKCTCGSEDCDCFKVEETRVREMKTEDIKTKEIKSEEIKLKEVKPEEPKVLDVESMEELLDCACPYPCDCKGAKLKAEEVSSDDYVVVPPVLKNGNGEEIQVNVIYP